MSQKKIDCFVAVESWLTSNHSDDFLSIDGFLSFRDDRFQRSGGGVIAWVRYSFNPLFLELNDKPSCIECVGVILRSCHLLLIACYIPPVPAVSQRACISQFFINTIDEFLNVNPTF